MIGNNKLAITVDRIESGKKLSENSLIRGLIIKKNSKFMIIDINYMSFVRLTKDDMWNYERFNVGNIVNLYITKFGSNDNETLATRKHLSTEEAWQELTIISKNNLWVDGIITAKIREGYTVNVLGLSALLPHHLIDKRATLIIEVGGKDKYKLSHFNKQSNIIILTKPVTSNINKINNSLTYADKVMMGIIVDITNEEIIIDFGWKRGIIILTHTSWYDTIDLIKHIHIGSLIIVMYHEQYRHTPNCLTLKISHNNFGIRNIPILATLTQKLPNQLYIQISKSLLVPIVNCFTNIDIIISSLIRKKIDLGMTVRIIPTLISYMENILQLTLDLKFTKCFNLALASEGQIIKGQIIKLVETFIIVKLTNKRYGEAHFISDSKREVENWCRKTRIKLINFRICSYNPITNKLILTLAKTNTLKLLWG